LSSAGASPQTTLVFYGEGPNTWWAFNAALRAAAAGHGQVLWYRGGLQAWQRAGLPTQQKTAVAVLS
jgi:3-mercaptopyruvate sulfurtransferase SseA